MQEVNKIYVTKDYEKFQWMKANRSLDPKHLQKIKMSLLEKQLPIPIIINENYEILEGQHRFFVCQHEKLPLYYMIIEGVTIKDAIKINTISKGWKANDYFKFYLDLNYEQYKRLEYFMNVTGLNLFDARLMIEGNNNGNSTHSFNEGNFECLDVAEALKRHEMYLDFKGAPCFSHKSFKIALMKLFTSDAYDHERMLEQLGKGLIESLTMRQNMVEYVKQLTTIYNMNKTRKNVIHFNVDYKGNLMAFKSDRD